MATIRDLLEMNHNHYSDKHLSWGAKLSEYAEELVTMDDNSIPVFIELELDVPYPEKSLIIDHHGEMPNFPSSLEQVAALLGIELSRHEQLVAANDAAYIPGMKRICATDEEIEAIRLADRQAQGVSSEEESLAQKTLKENNNHVIFSPIPHFSPISDRMYLQGKRRYVIYDKRKIVFYGFPRVELLLWLSENQIAEEKIYSGGGECGYLGLREGMLNEKEIESLAEKSIALKTNDPYSYHTFMFPFVYDEILTASFDEDWRYKEFTISSHEDYNEYVYFYDYVRKALYNRQDQPEDQDISQYYEYKDEQGTFSIDCALGQYELDLDGVSLRLFPNSKVGILSFNLKNYYYFNPSDVLAINEFGRRIYPQFVTQNGLCETKKAFLPESITLTFKGRGPIREPFENRDNVEDYLIPHSDSYNQRLPLHILTLLQGVHNPRSIIDDRMFVMSLYMNDGLANRVKFYNPSANEYRYERDDWWYKYIFVDGSDKTCQSIHMTKKLIGESTYDRWVEYGTLYGISRYSFVALTGSWFGKNRLSPHFRTMYFQMFTLLLAYRASIIKFSDDVVKATKKVQDIEPKDVYDGYLKFVNELFFREITAQEQGIELYNQAMKIMQIEKYITDLDHEIGELHQYVQFQIEDTRKKEEEERKKRDEARQRSLDNLTRLGTYLLPPSLISALMGMNIISFEGIDRISWILIWLVSTALAVYSAFLVTSDNKQVDKKMKWYLSCPICGYILALGIVFGFAGLGIYDEWKKPDEKPTVKVMINIKEKGVTDSE